MGFGFVSVFPGKPGPVTHNIQIQMAPQSPPTFQQYRTPLETPAGHAKLTASQQQQLPELRGYQERNIPSRSFKIVQTMNPAHHENLGSGR